MKRYKIKVGEQVYRGTATQLEKAFEKLGYQAQRDGDSFQAQLYLNYAEHYKKMP